MIEGISLSTSQLLMLLFSKASVPSALSLQADSLLRPRVSRALGRVSAAPIGAAAKLRLLQARTPAPCLPSDPFLTAKGCPGVTNQLDPASKRPYPWTHPCTPSPPPPPPPHHRP